MLGAGGEFSSGQINHECHSETDEPRIAEQVHEEGGNGLGFELFHTDKKPRQAGEREEMDGIRWRVG